MYIHIDNILKNVIVSSTVRNNTKSDSTISPIAFPFDTLTFLWGCPMWTCKQNYRRSMWSMCASAALCPSSDGTPPTYEQSSNDSLSQIFTFCKQRIHICVRNRLEHFFSRFSQNSKGSRADVPLTVCVCVELGNIHVQHICK